MTNVRPLGRSGRRASNEDRGAIFRKQEMEKRGYTNYKEWPDLSNGQRQYWNKRTFYENEK